MAVTWWEPLAEEGRRLILRDRYQPDWGPVSRETRDIMAATKPRPPGDGWRWSEVLDQWVRDVKIGEMRGMFDLVGIRDNARFEHDA